MRKTTLLLMGLIALFVLGSCSKSNTPRSVAEQSLQCLKEKKYDKYVDLVYFEEEAKGNKELLKKRKAETKDLIQNKYNASVQQFGAITDFTYIDEEVKDSTAVVNMKVTYSSGTEKDQKVKLKMLPNGKWRVDTKGK